MHYRQFCEVENQRFAVMTAMTMTMRTMNTKPAIARMVIIAQDPQADRAATRTKAKKDRQRPQAGQWRRPGIGTRRLSR